MDPVALSAALLVIPLAGDPVRRRVAVAERRQSRPPSPPQPSHLAGTYKLDGQQREQIGGPNESVTVDARLQ